MSKYVAKHISEVFAESFVNYMVEATVDGLQMGPVNLMLKRIEEYEAKHKLLFMTFMGTELLIFEAVQKDQ